MPPCAHRVAIGLQIQSWAGEAMILGPVFLNPFASPEKKPQFLICGIVQTDDSRTQTGNLRKQGVLRRDAARFGGR